jgi:hypothetical protein
MAKNMSYAKPRMKWGTFDWTLLISRTKHIFRPVISKIAFLRMYLTPLVRLGTPKFRRFILDLIPWKTLHQLRDISDDIHNTAVEIVNSKKRALEDGDEAVARQIGQGKDVLSILSRVSHSSIICRPHF